MRLILIASDFGELAHALVGLPGLGLLTLVVLIFSISATAAVTPSQTQFRFTVAVIITAVEVFWIGLFLSKYDRDIGQEQQRFMEWLQQYAWGPAISVVSIVIAWCLKRWRK